MYTKAIENLSKSIKIDYSPEEIMFTESFFTRNILFTSMKISNDYPRFLTKNKQRLSNDYQNFLGAD